MASIALTLFLVLATSSCPGDAPDDGAISSVRAVELANASAPSPVSGVFQFEVKASEAREDRTFLNSEVDYRDQRNVSVVISAEAAAQLQAKLGAPPAEALRGRVIRITGQAERATIRFSSDGMPTGLYYYQTRIRVTDGGQISVLPNDA